MNAQRANVPKLRFPGFTDDWEQRKLSTLCENITVGIANSATHAYRENGIVMFRNQNIKENHLDDEDVIYIDKDFEKKYKNRRLKANDLLVARTGYPGTACVVPEKYEGAQTFTTLIARLKEGTNPFYACQYINSDYGKKYISATQIGGGQKNSGAGILENMPIMLPPTVEEQDIIAVCFTYIDSIITLHQRKLDQMKEYKQGMLQKMFPKEGESVPEIRFPGFTDDWEQRKVTELLKNTSDAIKIGPFGSALKKIFFTDKGIKVYAQENAFSGDFSIGNYYISEAKYNELKSCELKPGDLVISMMGTVGACAIFPENAEKGIMNSHLLRLQFSEEVLPEYIMFVLRDSQIIRDQIDRLSVGSIMTGLSSTVVKKLVFPVPKRPEQQKIVELLKQLDNLITLHQRKLSQIKEYKKGLLQQMFC